MKKPQQKVVHIQDKTDKAVLSKAQKQFNTLIKKIDSKKKLLQEWQKTRVDYQAKVAGEYEDLWQEYNQHRVELVHLFDAAFGQKLFTKADKNKLKHLIDTITTELIVEHGMEDLKDLYNKYNESDFDTENQAVDEEIGEMMKSIFKEMTGIEIDDDIDVSSPEKFEAALKAKMLEHQEQQQIAEEKRSKRKKTAKQLEKEAKQKEEAQNVSKSIQEVYRKLASSLHPDREPDETEREHKTKIMQEVNIAYEKKDLLRLLELQLELEHIDQTHLNTIAEDRLVHFNKILKEQVNELDEEIAFIEMGLQMQASWPPFMPFSPKQLIAKLDFDIEAVVNDIAKIKADIKTFQTPENLKRYLKAYKIPKQHEEPNLMDLLFR